MTTSSSRAALTSTRLRTPRAAAIAGAISSILLLAVFGLLRRSVPGDPYEPGAWLTESMLGVTVALNLVPFAGIAFLWFIGVLRDRLGAREDHFFATVFLGSGLLFVAMLFTSAAGVGAIILAFHAAPEAVINSATFHFARALAYSIIEIYVVKTACVFMVTTSTIALYTRLTPRWMAIAGLVAACLLFISSYFFDWGILVFPAWMLLISIHILLDRELAAAAPV